MVLSEVCLPSLAIVCHRLHRSVPSRAGVQEVVTSSPPRVRPVNLQMWRSSRHRCRVCREWWFSWLWLWAGCSWCRRCGRWVLAQAESWWPSQLLLPTGSSRATREISPTVTIARSSSNNMHSTDITSIPDSQSRVSYMKIGHWPLIEWRQ